MVSLLCLSLICLDLFAAVSATRPLTQRTPRRHSPIKHDTRIAGLLLVVFGRQARGPCCSNGGCCDAGAFCHGEGCCLDGQKACLDGACCLANEFCDDGGCCPIGKICIGPPPGTITFTGSTFTRSDNSFPTTTLEVSFTPFSSHSSFSVSSGGFGGPTTPFPSPTSSISLPAAGSITLPISGGDSTTPIPKAVSSTISTSNLPSTSVAGAGGAVSAASRAQPSILIAVAILSLSGYYL